MNRSYSGKVIIGAVQRRICINIFYAFINSSYRSANPFLRNNISHGIWVRMLIAKIVAGEGQLYYFDFGEALTKDSEKF